MKIFLVSVSAFLLFATWLGQVQSGSIDFRYKRRGPPPPPRPPPPQQYLKKWEQHRPPRGSARPPRPIPMQMVQNFMPPPVPAPVGPPMGSHVGPPAIPHNAPSVGPAGPPVRPTPVPIRTYWKNTKIPFQAIPEKAFHSSPQISSTREFDYHVQTNSIPTHSIPIKQLDEKGPIHTIPAPNLSLADKPIVVEEFSENKVKQSQQQPLVQPQKQIVQTHQYQVTEPNEVYVKSPQKNFREQQFNYIPEGYTNIQNQNYKNLQQPQFNRLPEIELYTNGQDASRLSQKELYQLLNSQLQQQQQGQIYDNYEIPILPQNLVQPQQHQHQHQQQHQQQQQQLHQLPYVDYQLLLGQTPLLQSDPSYLAQLPQLPQNSRDNNQVQFQGFTSERHAQNNFPSSDDQTTFITTDYNFKTAGPEGGTSYSVLQDPSKSEHNLPYVQEIFDLSEENAASINNGEQNIKVSEGETKPTQKEEQKADKAPFYTTLPNRQAAEALASLQAAGKINNNLNNLMQLTQQRPQNAKGNQRTPLEIYVPDSHSFGGQETHFSDSPKDKNGYGSRGSSQEEDGEVDPQDYDDGFIRENESADEQEDASRGNQSKQQSRNHNSFGSKIRPKQNQ